VRASRRARDEEALAADLRAIELTANEAERRLIVARRSEDVSGAQARGSGVER
jgi:hypothetical protein